MPLYPKRQTITPNPDKTDDERRLADEKLCRAMVNSIVDYAIILTDRSGHIISLNKGAEMILGYSEAEVTGLSIGIFYPREVTATDGPETNLQEAQVNNNYQVRGWRVKKDGTRFLANIHYTALYDEQHELIGYTKIIYELAGALQVVNEPAKIKHNPTQSNISFRKLIENSYSGISLLDKNFNLLYRSLSAERITGWSTFNRENRTVDNLTHPDDIQQLKALLQKVLISPNEPLHGTFRTLHQNGNYIWIDCAFTNFLDEPNVNAIVCNFIEITDRKVSEDRLQQTINELSAYQYALDEAAIVAITDQKGTIKHVNDNFCKISKYTREELIGHDHRIINSAYHDKGFIKNLWVTIANGKVWKGELKNKAKDGSFYWVDTTIIPFLDDTGKPYQYVAIRSDITEKKLAEFEIKKKTQQFESLLENILDGFIALDENLCYTYVNKQMSEFLGVPPQSLSGRYIWDVFPDLIGSEFYKLVEKAHATKTNFINEDYYEPLNTWQENRIYASEYGISIFIRDITSRKVNERQTSLLNDMGSVFNESLPLDNILEKVLKNLAEYGQFSLAEAWLVAADKRKIALTVKHLLAPGIGKIDGIEKTVTNFVKGEGLPGMVWESGKIERLENVAANTAFLRKELAKKLDIQTVFGIPLHFKKDVIGVIVLGLSREERPGDHFLNLFEKLSKSFGEEIRRKQLEQELSQLFNSAPDLICTAGSDGYWKRVNPAMVKLLGYSELELLNRPLLEFIHLDDRLVWIEKFQESVNGQAQSYLENRFITADGKIKWVAWTTSAASPEGLVYCVAKDITDKNELSQLLKKAYELARIGGWEIDLATGIVFWSDITKEIHEVSADYVPNLDSGISFYKEGISRDFITRKVKDAIEKGLSWDVELQIVTAKGNEKWVRAIGEVEMVNKKCVRIYGSFQDIDARKKAEISVTEILEERNTILESIGDCFFAVDKNWITTYWNSSAEKVISKRKEQVLNRPFWEVFSDAVGSVSYQKYHEAIASNTAVHFEDFYAPLATWFEISAYPSEGGLAVYFKDINERKLSERRLNELNESLRQQTKELATSNAELEQFAYVASHDLQEPLRMVTSFLTQIERKYQKVLDDKGRQYINFAVDGAKRMRQIILDLLEFSRAGSLEDDVEDVVLDTIITEILALYRKQIEERKAMVSFEKLPVVRTRKTPLRLVLSNLIGNSLKYSRPDIAPCIGITCLDKGSHWQISVSDNGLGIEPEYFDKIFIIFQRLHTRDEYPGNGMGLAITKKVVENLGGNIWVESVFGQGSVFHFTISKKSGYEVD